MRQLKVGIIGYGRSGRDIHAEALRRVPELYSVVAVADLLGERRARAERELGCASFEDYRAMAEEMGPDLVVNAAYSHLHVPITIDLLKMGRNVLCDKPLARRASDIDRIAKAAAKAKRTAVVFHQSSLAPYFRKVKEVADSGRIGRVVQVTIRFNGFGRRWDWQTLQGYNGGSLLNTGPHPVDQAVRFLGVDAKPEVFCVMDRANSFGDAEDFVHLLLRASGRPVVEVEISSSTAFPSQTYDVQGTLGSITGTMSNVRWKWFDPAEAPARKLVREPLCNPDGTPAYCVEELIWHEDSWTLPPEHKNFYGEMAAEYYTRLHAHLTAGSPPPVTLEEARRVVSIMEECHRQNPMPRIRE
jgi:predicted dehydrogenase